MTTDNKPKAKTKCHYTPEECYASGSPTEQRQGLAADGLRANLRHARIYAGAPLLVLLVVFYSFQCSNTEDNTVFHNAQTLLPLWACPSGLNTGRGRSQDLPGPHLAYSTQSDIPGNLIENMNNGNI